MSGWSILAIYILVWIFVAFVLLPFGVRTDEEMGVDLVPGQAESAPANFRPGRLALRAAAAKPCSSATATNTVIALSLSIRLFHYMQWLIVYRKYS